jgi:hypothetical protein
MDKGKLNGAQRAATLAEVDENETNKDPDGDEDDDHFKFPTSSALPSEDSSSGTVLSVTPVGQQSGMVLAVIPPPSSSSSGFSPVAANSAAGKSAKSPVAAGTSSKGNSIQKRVSGQFADSSLSVPPSAVATSLVKSYGIQKDNDAKNVDFDPLCHLSASREVSLSISKLFYEVCC